MNTSLIYSIALILALLFIVFAGCTTPGGPGAAGPTPAPATEGAPAGTGAADTGPLVSQFDSYAEKTFTTSGVPGMAVAIVKDDKVIYSRCFGVRNITTKEPVGPDTRFQLASISKSMTGTLIASMAGNGELSWDDTIVSADPGFMLSDPYVTKHATYRDLLSHRSGLPAYGGDDLQNGFGYSRQEIMDRLRYLGLTGDFRSSYAYSNVGITIAGEAAAKKAGTSFEDLVAERIFVPAGMYNTSAQFVDFAGSADRAESHQALDGTPATVPSYNDDANSPAGGVSSTLNDMIRYARMQANGGSIDNTQVVNASALRESHTPQYIRTYSGTEMTGSAMGWNTILRNKQSRFEKDGMFSDGVATIISVWPEERMALVALTNGYPEGNALAGSISNGWNDLYYNGRIQKDWYDDAQQELQKWFDSQTPDPIQEPADPQPARGPEYYTGSYTQDYYGTVRVEADGTKLLVYPGRSTTPFGLVPYDGDTFREESGMALVRFDDGTNATAATAWFGRFEAPGRSGAFVRVAP